MVSPVHIECVGIVVDNLPDLTMRHFPSTGLRVRPFQRDGLAVEGGFKGSDPLCFVLDQRACCMSGSETIASLWGVSRPSSTPSYAAPADPMPQCFDVQLMLQMMKDFVADRAVIA